MRVVLIALVLLLGGCLDGGDSFATGRVILIDDAMVPADGPTVIELRDSSGTEDTVHVSSGPCVAKDIAPPGSFAIGDVLAVRGAMDIDGAILPCHDADHFLRVIDSAR